MQQKRQVLDRAHFIKSCQYQLISVGHLEFPEQFGQVHFNALVGKVYLFRNLFDGETLDNLTENFCFAFGEIAAKLFNFIRKL